MRPDRMTEAHRTDGLAELVCSNSFRSDDAANNAVGLLHAEMRRLGSLIMRAADANQVPAGGALAVDRDGFSAAVTKALDDHPLIEIDRTEIAGLPPADWGNVIVATGPLTSAPLADAIRELTDERRAGVLRCHRADRAQGFHRHVGGMVSVALRQGRSRRHRRRLHQLPDEQGAVRRLRRRADRRRKDRLQGLGNQHALFRRLPADRGDGRARPRDAAPRADEAGRAHQSARSDREGLRHRAAAPGQQARHALQSWSASRPS